MNDEQKLKLLKSQVAPWVTAIGIVAVVLVINRAFEHPSLIVGPVTIMLLLCCFFFARGNLAKSIDDLGETSSESSD